MHAGSTSGPIYGKWVDLLCRSQDDWRYYREKARELAELANDYWKAFQESPESRAKLEGLKVPSDHIPYTGTHREILTWLYGRIDFIVQLEYRAGFDETDGHMAVQVWNGQLLFMPPTIAYRKSVGLPI